MTAAKRKNRPGSRVRIVWLIAIPALLVSLVITGVWFVRRSTPVTLTLWYHAALSAPEGKVIAETVREFNQSQKGIIIVPVVLPESNYNEYVKAAVKKGQSPDILDIDGPLLTSYVRSRQLIPLDSNISAAKQSDLLPSIRTQGTIDGHLYGVGQFDSGLAIWGNRRLLTMAGIRIPDSVDTAWSEQEFVDALSRLKKLPGVKYPLDIKLDYGSSEWLTYGFQPLLASYGGSLTDPRSPGEVSGFLNGQQSIRALSNLQSWYRAGYIKPATSKDTFEAGSVGLSWVGHWMWADYNKGLGDDLVLIPMPKFGSRAVTAMGSWVWTVPSGSQHPKEAARFIEYLLQNKNILAMTEANGAVPATNSSIAESALYKPGGRLRLYADQLRRIAEPRPKTEYYEAISLGFRRAFLQIITDNANVQSALDAAVEGIRKDTAPQ